MSVRVLIVDDHAILREGLRALLYYYKDLEVVGEAQDGNEAIKLVKSLSPDVVIMDIAMPGMGGIDATRLILKERPHTAILALTQYEDWRYAKSLLEAGALGYVSKRTLGTDLVQAIRTVARGKRYIDPAVAAALEQQEQTLKKNKDQTLIIREPLTPREEEILSYIAQGKTNAQIAKILSLSVKTVEYHRTNLMSKLNANNVADLVRYAVKLGLV